MKIRFEHEEAHDLVGGLICFAGLVAGCWAGVSVCKAYAIDDGILAGVIAIFFSGVGTYGPMLFLPSILELKKPKA